MGTLTEQALARLEAAKHKDRLLDDAKNVIIQARITRDQSDMAARRAALDACRDAGCTWREIEDAVGLTRQHMWTICK